MLAACINPSGAYGAVYPFLILKEYEFPVLENTSAWALSGAGFDFLPASYFQIVFGLTCLSWLYLVRKDRQGFSIGNLLLTAIFSAMAWWAVRNFVLFGYFALPLVAINLRRVSFVKNKLSPSGVMLRSTGVLLATAIVLVVVNPRYFFGRGRGSVKTNPAAADFFVAENLQGPIFNNYDVGGYLIRHLYPKHRVFADNRPEAYPASFFRDVYFPIQMTEENWTRMGNEFGFNVIVFNHRERSRLSEQFLVRRVLDPAWAPVFMSKDIIVLLKRYGPNQSVIEKYELPKERVLEQSN